MQPKLSVTHFLLFHMLLEYMDLEVILQGLETDGQTCLTRKGYLMRKTEFSEQSQATAVSNLAQEVLGVNFFLWESRQMTYLK